MIMCLTSQAKVQMLDNLLDIEVAYSLLRGGAEDNKKDPIDINYEKLRTGIEVFLVLVFSAPVPYPIHMRTSASLSVVLPGHSAPYSHRLWTSLLQKLRLSWIMSRILMLLRTIPTHLK